LKVSKEDLDGVCVKDNETYTVIDNTSLQNLVVSKTILHPSMQTTGHAHEGQEEVYQFVHGAGHMEVGPDKFPVSAGDVVLIPDGHFHKVFNDSIVEDLTFICVFDGKRSH
jgi:mannose-6-phosphate isomerase-like protein (cupin superfamily)